MEKRTQTPPEARAASIAAYFDSELKKISDRAEKAKSLGMGVDTNGAVIRRQQQILHFEERQTELNHARSFVLGVLVSAQSSEVSGIGYYFVGKIDEIDLEIERIQAHPSSVTFDKGIVRGKKQELKHLATVRADIIRVGQHVLGILGQPPLSYSIDSKANLNQSTLSTDGNK